MSTRLLNLPAIPRWWTRSFTLTAIVLFSILLHGWSVWQLPVDYDEPVYLKAGHDYARFIKTGSLGEIIEYQDNREHPPLTKLLYSIPFLLADELPGNDFYLYAARSISALFGVLAIYFLARRNLWAGFFLAFHSMTLKYTSQAYLEALPMLMVILAVLSLEKAQQGRGKYFWLSAVFLGLAGAAKYPYLIIAFVLLYMLIRKRGMNIQEISVYFLTALTAFVVFNPNFWTSPFAEIVKVINFHTSYSQSLHVQLSNYVWYQPVLFLATSVPWHPQVFFFLTLDEFIFWIAFVGLYWEVKAGKWEALWLIGVLLFLLLWPTKWPQYTMMLTPALAMVAGNSVERAIAWIRPKEDYWNYLEEMLPQPPRITWWILIIFVSGLLLGKVVYEYQLANARRGWETYTSKNSPLLNDFVADINTEKKGSIAIASRQGLEIWESSLQIPVWGETPQQFSLMNLGLPGQQLRQIAYDATADVYWLGSEGGISRVGEQITHFENKDIGCQICSVNDLAVDSLSQVWAATNEGIFLYSFGNWHNFSAENPGLQSQVVLSILVLENESHPAVWAGTLAGISHYEYTSKSWTNTNWASNFFGWGGVQDIIASDDGKIVAATSGGGIGIWDNDNWTFYRNSNSPMRSNTVLALTESPGHDFWFGLGYPTEPGGYLLELDSQGKWQKYFLNTSGFQEGEPVDLEFDQFGRLWIATNGQGFQTYYFED